MEPVPCIACGTFFTPRNKDQGFCSKACQHVRKALWQKKRLATDPDYKQGQRLAQKKWLQNNPDYWKNYRLDHPEKAERNRSLQKIRNTRKQNLYCKTTGIAKMDPVKIFIASVSGFSP